LDFVSFLIGPHCHGIAIPEFPNMFFQYGPQAPTAFSNEPSCTQFQAEFIDKALGMLAKDNILGSRQRWRVRRTGIGG
jgi:hypothetical protein